MTRTYENSKGQTFSTHAQALASNTAMGTNPSAPNYNPVGSSTPIRAGINALGADISGLQSAYAADNAQIQAQMAALAERRVNEVAGIKTEFDIAKLAQETGQAGDYASRATSLITSGGGFLGGTQSQQGVLQNLRATFDSEKTALMAKREAAIQAANQAYEDKDFALARELSKNAKDLQNEIYGRQKDFAEQSLAITREDRANNIYEMDLAEKKIKAYSEMDDASFANVSQSQIESIDSIFGAGYTNSIRKINKSIADGKNLKDNLSLQSSLQTLINKTPQGQKITLADGSVYMGMKKPIGNGSTAGKISSALANQLGVPSLAGKDESDIILSFSLASAPQWYKDYHKSSGLNASQINSDWAIFRKLPDIDAYAKSSTVTARIAGTNNIWGGITPEAIAASLADYQDE